MGRGRGEKLRGAGSGQVGNKAFGVDAKAVIRQNVEPAERRAVSKVAPEDGHDGKRRSKQDGRKDGLYCSLR